MVCSGARRARVLRLATAGPQDTAPLAAAIDRGDVDPATIVAIVGKTEGNGCVNDFTRGYATLALKLLLGEMAEALLLSGQRVVPDKIRRLGYIFHFDSLDAALRDLFP